MKFLNLKIRRADILLIPIAFIAMFIWQYNSIQSQIKEADKQIDKKLEELSKECRAGDHKACEEYSALLESAIKNSALKN